LSVFDAYADSPAASSGVLLTFLVYFATLGGSIIAYRISPFHPLAKYPGPFVAKLSKLWMVCPSAFILVIEADRHAQVFISSTGKQHEYFASLHEKYGDIVRTGEQFPS
jgi:hypothetical protein